MFEEKATVTLVNSVEAALNARLDQFNHQMESFVSLMGSQHRAFDDRMSRYSRRLSSIMADIDQLFSLLDQHSAVINQNASAGEKTLGVLMQHKIAIDQAVCGLEALAAEDGKKFETLPEIPAEITLQPGLPARIGLTKNGKPTRKATLPAPVTLSVDEMNRGLALTR